MFKNIVRVIYVTLFCCGAVLALWGGSADAGSSRVRVLEVKGTIVPVVADYISRGISEAEDSGDEACVIILNTPGGLLDTTEKIVGRIMNAGVPVIVYVAPQGAWAASAGTFIAVSAHISAMAPATSIGAAHPVSVGEEMTETAQKKATEYSVAWIASIAEKRGRDPVQVEAAVRESKSFTSSQAVENKLVDLTADDMDSLLMQLNGRKVVLADGKEVILNTEGADVIKSDMTALERFLHMISHPNIAYILLTLASIGLITEISNPGLIFPGVIGGLCLFLAFYSLGVLNAYWAGLALILLALGLFVTEIFVPAYGILTSGGIVSLVIGSLILFSGSDSSMEFDKSLIIYVAIFFALFVGLLVWAAVRGQRRRVTTGQEGMIGQVALVKIALEPQGMVLVEGELWKAILDEGSASAGEEVIVKKVDKLKLLVTRKK